MNNKNIYKTLVIVTAFLLLGAGLQLSFKQNSVLTQGEFNSQKASVGNVATSPVSTQTKTDPRMIDLPKASKATGLPLSQLTSIVSNIAGGGSLGACLGSSGGVTAKGQCNPPGPGVYTGSYGPFGPLPGRDLAPCSVSGLKGGSVVAMCWQGCCRAFSVSKASGALNLSNLSPMQMIELGLKGYNLLSQFGFIGNKGGGYNTGNNNDTYVGVTGTDTNTYLTGTSTVSGTPYDFNTYSYDNLDSSNTVSSNISTDTPKFEVQQVINDSINQPSIFDNIQQVQIVDVKPPKVTSDSDFAIADTPSKQDAKYYEFQQLENKKNQDPRLNDLRNPDSSSVRQSLSQKPDLIYEKNVTNDKRSFWQIIVDIITKPFKK